MKTAQHQGSCRNRPREHGDKLKSETRIGRENNSWNGIKEKMKEKITKDRKLKEIKRRKPAPRRIRIRINNQRRIGREIEEKRRKLTFPASDSVHGKKSTQKKTGTTNSF